MYPSFHLIVSHFILDYQQLLFVFKVKGTTVKWQRYDSGALTPVEKVVGVLTGVLPPVEY